jgi:hypothetical protein
MIVYLKTSNIRLTAKLYNVLHKLYVDKLFLSPVLLDNLHIKTMNCCETVIPNTEQMLMNFGHEMKLKQGDTRTWVRSNFTSICMETKKCEYTNKDAFSTSTSVTSMEKF